MRFGTWNAKSLYTAGSLKTVGSEMAKYNLDLVSVQEVRWVEADNQQTIIHLSLEMGMLVISWGQASFIHKGIVSAVKGVEFISGRMLYITLRSHQYDIVLNVHAPTKNKSDNTKHSFYEELKHIFDQFTKYHMKICYEISVQKERRYFQTKNWE
jgi:hypothetical protein